MNIPGGESWPRLTGLDRDYLVAQLKAFKDGPRSNASMLAFASMLNDEQMVDVASYLVVQAVCFKHAAFFMCILGHSP